MVTCQRSQRVPPRAKDQTARLHAPAGHLRQHMPLLSTRGAGHARQTPVRGPQAPPCRSLREPLEMALFDRHAPISTRHAAATEFRHAETTYVCQHLPVHARGGPGHRRAEARTSLDTVASLIRGAGLPWRTGRGTQRRGARREMVRKADKELPERVRQRGHPPSSGRAGRAAKDPSRGPPAPSQLASHEACNWDKFGRLSVTFVPARAQRPRSSTSPPHAAPGTAEATHVPE